MDPQTSFIDRDVRPYACYQFILADDLTCPFDQDDENFQRAAAEVKRNSGPFESSSRCMQAKRPRTSPHARATTPDYRSSKRSPIQRFVLCLNPLHLLNLASVSISPGTEWHERGRQSSTERRHCVIYARRNLPMIGAT